MRDDLNVGINSIIGENAVLGKNVSVRSNCIIEDGAVIGDDCYIDCNTIIRHGVSIGAHSTIGANCILGEYVNEFYVSHNQPKQPLKIGNDAIIRSGSIIYGGSEIGQHFSTGHRITIREGSIIGNHVSVGTLSDIQGHCAIGNYVRMHSNVHIGQKSRIEDYVWIFPYAVLTNDPTPPSENLLGVHINSFAVIATGSIILPGIEIEQDSLIAAGAIVTKDVKKFSVVAGNPAKPISDVRKIKNKVTGEYIYPWRYHFERGMPWEGIGYEAWYSSMDFETELFSSRPASPADLDS